MENATMTNKQTKILCIGDSIVEGYPYGLEASWVFEVEAIRAQEGKKELWINAGISGQTTAEIRSRLGYALLRWKPDLVILSCGTNDFLFLEGRAGQPDSAWENIRAMATIVHNCGVKVIIAAPPLTISRLATRRWSDGTDYDEVNRKLKALHQRIGTWCKERSDQAAQDDREIDAAMWDVQSLFLQLCGDGTAEEGTEAARLEERYFVDGLHPTREGYRRMAESLCEKLPLMNF